jgi:TolB-like protein
MTIACHLHDSKNELLDYSAPNVRRSRTVAAGLLFVLFLACVFLLSCTTTTELKINRPKEVVDRAVMNVQSKLQLDRRQIKYFSSVEQDEYTDLKITMFIDLKDYLPRALFQEFYLLDGHSLPPNPPFFVEKNWWRLTLRSLPNAGLALNYALRDYAGYGSDDDSRVLNSILFGAQELGSVLFLVSGIVASVLFDEDTPNAQASEMFAAFGVQAGLSGLFATKLLAVLAGLEYNKRHNIGLESGYNFDHDYDVTQFFDIPIEWKPGVLSGMDSDAVHLMQQQSSMKERTLAVVAIEATGDNESVALQDFVANDLVGLGFSKVVDRQTIVKVIASSPHRGEETLDSSAARDIGRSAGADLVVIGSMTTLGETFYLNLKLISVETGEVIASSVASAKSRDDFLKMSNSAVEELAGAP